MMKTMTIQTTLELAPPPPWPPPPPSDKSMSVLLCSLIGGYNSGFTAVLSGTGHACLNTAPGARPDFCRADIALGLSYVTEAVDLLAALASTLADAVRAASKKAFVLLDGTLLPIDRIAADRPFYSGKHKKHGVNVQVLTDPSGRLLWASPALPGAVHDIRAAREHGIIDALPRLASRAEPTRAIGVPAAQSASRTGDDEKPFPQARRP
jgi:hypothetical protein